MDILLTAVEIVDKRSPLHGKKRNVHLKNGIIESISTKKTNAKKIVDAKGLKLSIGWFDLGAFIGDPGLEYKEDLKSGRKVAAAGGFTSVAILPNTTPVIQTKNDIAYITRNNKNSLTQILPLAAATQNSEGKELTEMIDLHHAGAVGFTDGLNPIWHTDIVLKSLQYLQKFDGVLINRPEDTMLTKYGSMHEGVESTTLGLKGMPSLSEEVMISRDLQLLEYAGGSMHFSNISTAGAIALIRKAKKDWLKVTCDVVAHQVVFDDRVLSEFDTNYKVNPPFRSKKDIQAIKKGLKDGTIDIIVSGHRPEDEEHKKLEFDLAEFGILGLQTFYPTINNYYNEIDEATLVEKFSVNPRALLNLAIPEIKEGAVADLTLFNPKAKWTYDEKTNLSKSKNSPFLGQEMVGKVIGIFNNNMSTIF